MSYAFAAFDKTVFSDCIHIGEKPESALSETKKGLAFRRETFFIKPRDYSTSGRDAIACLSSSSEGR